MKRTSTLLLALCLLLMLVGLAFAVPSGSITPDAADRYQDEQNADGDDSWLLDY